MRTRPCGSPDTTGNGVAGESGGLHHDLSLTEKKKTGFGVRLAAVGGDDFEQGPAIATLIICARSTELSSTLSDRSPHRTDAMSAQVLRFYWAPVSSRALSFQIPCLSYDRVVCWPWAETSPVCGRLHALHRLCGSMQDAEGRSGCCVGNMSSYIDPPVRHFVHSDHKSQNAVWSWVK